MTDEQEPDALAKAIRLLTIAVWCLCTAVIAQVGLYVWGYVTTMRWSRQTFSSSTTPAASKGSKDSHPPTIEWESLHDLPPEQMVARATVQVVFMAGNPASMRSSYGFTNGRIGGLGDIPLTTLREMVKKKKS